MMGLAAWSAIAIALVFAPLAVTVLGDDDFDGSKDVTLYLYTQSNPSEAEYVTLDDSTSPNFNSANPTRVAIHGWQTNVNESLLPFINAYIDTGDEYNIILVDWSGPASETNITIAVQNAIKVGEYIAQVLDHLIESRGLNPDALTIIGHSLGSHVAGIVGNRMRRGPASEVVGLDPANIELYLYPLEDQLDISDGKFVQVIHTDLYNLGSPITTGHINFYPNGGMNQTGCANLEGEGCSHNRVVSLYVESINSNGLVASKCTNYLSYERGLCSSNEHVIMGEWTPHNEYGVFYLDTNGASPYGKGETSL